MQWKNMYAYTLAGELWVDSERKYNSRTYG